MPLRPHRKRKSQVYYAIVNGATCQALENSVNEDLGKDQGLVPLGVPVFNAGAPDDAKWTQALVRKREA